MALFSFSSKQPVQINRNKDRYKIIGLLGKGQFSDVFNCFDTELNRVVALKQLRTEFVSDPSIFEAFLNEAKMLAFLEHPGVMMLYDIFIDEAGVPAYTMKLVKGNNLRCEYGLKTRAQLLNIFIKLCETLASVHDHGVIHLDLNPENVMLGAYGEVAIIDWGNAKLFDDSVYKEYMRFVVDAPQPPSTDNVIQNKTISRYFSPEQIKGDIDSFSPSSDIFSMGIIMYEMLSGTVPFYTKDPKMLSKQILECNYTPLHVQCPDLPKFLSQICAKMITKDPYNRYHSFNAILTDLDRFQNSGQAFKRITLRKGEVLCQEGQQGDFAFIILAGTLEVSRISNGQKIVLAYLNPEEIGGELALFTNEPRSATITAIKDTTISLLSRESVENELIKLSPWVQKMIYGLSKRFLKLNDLLVM